MKFRIGLIIILSSIVSSVYSQIANPGELSGQQSKYNTITTAVPFLMIAPDARAGAMGDAGVSSSADVYSMHWNPAKYAFIEEDMGFGISYTPWLKNLVPDINLYNVSFFKRIDNEQVIAASLVYFSLGDIKFTDQNNFPLGTFRPNEFSIDVAYARKLSENFSASVAARFIYSDLTQGQAVAGSQTNPGTSIAADISMFYRKDIQFSRLDGLFAFGLNISNIGSKISYSDNGQKNFLPTNLRFGPSLTLEIDRYNTLSFMLDFNKLLVPTPPIYETTENGQQVIGPDNKPVIRENGGKDPDVSVISGIFQSFFDAPGGLSEEIKEFTYSLGMEYWYDKQFAVRAGYFHESQMKGNRKYFTLGIGLKYNVFGLDLAYLVPTAQQHPLENTLRFSLIFNFESY